MAKPSFKLIEALRSAAKQIGNKSNYNWKDIGSCNCGNLAQILTGYDKKEITRFGIKKHGDWDMLSRLYRKESGYEIDLVISIMLEAGLLLDDFTHLENLSDKRILNRIGENMYLKRDNREDVILYMTNWAEMLEEELINSVNIDAAKEMLEVKIEPEVKAEADQEDTKVLVE